jgi:hypothetical protein
MYAVVVPEAGDERWCQTQSRSAVFFSFIQFGIYVNCTLIFTIL